MTTDFLLDHQAKSFPAHLGSRWASELAAQGWNVLANDLAYPLAVIREDALAHNLAWMQAFVQRKGVWLAPHGKTLMSPQLCERQLAAGACTLPPCFKPGWAWRPGPGASPPTNFWPTLTWTRWRLCLQRRLTCACGSSWIPWRSCT